MSHIHPVFKSMRYAIDGLKQAFFQEPNFRFHILIMLIVFGAGLFLGLSSTEWLFIIFTITLVIILELINTSVEELVDLASPRIHPKAKIAKDVAAAAVLIASLMAVVVGLIIFLPKFI